MDQCSRLQPAGTPPHQRSSPPRDQRGHGLRPGIRCQAEQVLTRQALPEPSLPLRANPVAPIRLSRRFTDRYPHPIGMAADVAKLPDGSCECQALSAICPCRSWCSGGNGRTATDGVRTRHLICRFARRNGRCDALGRRSTAGAVDVGLASQACCPGHPSQIRLRPIP
jgi:hypothetical protein